MAAQFLHLLFHHSACLNRMASPLAKVGQQTALLSDKSFLLSYPAYVLGLGVGSRKVYAVKERNLRSVTMQGEDTPALHLLIAMALVCQKQNILSLASIS